MIKTIYFDSIKFNLRIIIGHSLPYLVLKPFFDLPDIRVEQKYILVYFMTCSINKAIMFSRAIKYIGEGKSTLYTL